ncbi:MAG TPA: TraB/GumN family protein [Prevotella sp.]|nr:TraB/GumN family protein [Prevotella sp.]
MKKIILTALAALCLTVNASAQLLYKVTADSLAKPSYIVATHDFINPMGYVDRIDSLKEAMTETEQVYFDIDRTANDALLKEAGKLPAGKTLASLLNEPQTQQLDRFLKKYTEVSWKSAYNQKRYNGRTPLAVLEDFIQLLFVANHMGEYDPTHTFQQYFAAQAKKNNEPTGGIFDVKEYAKLLQSVPLEMQAKAFTIFFDHQDEVLDAIDKSVAAYKAKDMDAAAAALGGTMNPMGGNLLTQESVQVMERVMRDKPTLFALPCYVLGGEQGIISRLKAQGYRVQGVD